MWKASLLYAKWQFNWNAKLLIELCIANRRQFQVTEASSLEVDKSYKFYKIFLCDIYYWPELLNFIFLYSVDKDTGILKRLFNEKWYLVIFRNFKLLTTACCVLRGESDCAELVAQLLRLFVPTPTRVNFRPRDRGLLVGPSSRTVSHRKSPLVRPLPLLNALLASAPECDLFAGRWSEVRDELLRFCETMDARPSTVWMWLLYLSVVTCLETVDA